MKTLLLAIYLINSIFQLNDSPFIGKSYFSKIKEEEISNMDFIVEANIELGYQMYLYNNNKKYELYNLCVLLDDFIGGSLISYGSYYEVKDSIVLKDELYGYIMTMKRNKNHLTFTRAFNDLQNRSFTFKRNESTKGDWHNFNINKIKQANKKKYKNIKNFSCGIYYGELVNNFYLKLDSAGNYCYYVERLPLSKGKWKKKGSQILLKDDSVDAVFSLLITKEGLVSQLVPGDLEGMLILKKIR